MMSVLVVQEMVHVSLRKYLSFILNKNNYYIMIICVTEKSALPRVALVREAVPVDLESAVLWQSPVEDPLLTITATLSRLQLPQ